MKEDLAGHLQFGVAQVSRNLMNESVANVVAAHQVKSERNNNTHSYFGGISKRSGPAHCRSSTLCLSAQDHSASLDPVVHLPALSGPRDSHLFAVTVQRTIFIRRGRGAFVYFSLRLA